MLLYSQYLKFFFCSSLQPLRQLVSLFERVLVVRLIKAARTVSCKETVAPLQDTIFDRRTELARLILILGSLSRAHRASGICVNLAKPLNLPNNALFISAFRGWPCFHSRQ
jgi:hypothetical protein